MSKDTRIKKNTSSRAARKIRQGKQATADKRGWWKLLGKLMLCGLAVMVAVLIYMDAVITQSFEGRKWAIPAKVYAKPLELFKGQRLSPNMLQEQLRRQGYQPVEEISRSGTYSRSGNALNVFTRSFIFPDGWRTARQARITFENNIITAISSLDDGKRIPILRLDPQIMGSIYPASAEDRVLARLTDIPKTLTQGLITVEDRDFYEHAGISLKGIARAMMVNLQAGNIVQGGSTLTQQLVKNFYLTNERTFTRKIMEVMMSVLLDLRYSKDDILEAYSNEVYLGQQGQRSIHGFALASQFYFGRPLNELDLSRQALLIGLVKGPSYYNPRRYPERAKKRRDLVLDMMVDHDIISARAAEQAKSRSLGVVPRQRQQTNIFPAYIDLVKRQLRRDYRYEDLSSEGLQIFSNMDPLIQQQAQRALSDQVRRLDHGKDTGLEAAMVVTDAQTGSVQAVVGGRDAGFAGFNRALDARRPIGSLVKPAIYLTALSNPSRFTLATRLKDESLTLTEKSGRTWSPQNYDKRSHGDVLLYEALAKSYNQATVQLGMKVGVPAVINTLKTMGMSKEPAPYPSLLLGALDLSPVEVAAMYQSLASGGYRLPLRAINAVLTADNRPLNYYNLSMKEVFSPQQVTLTNFMLGKVMSEGTGRGAYRYLPRSVTLAGKTGTTDDRRDSWFAGYSRDTLAVVWLGRDDNSSTRYSGSSGALRVWSDFMSQQTLKSVVSPETANITYHLIERETGLLGGEGCTSQVNLPFIKGSAPKESAPCVQKSPVKNAVDWFRSLWD